MELNYNSVLNLISEIQSCEADDIKEILNVYTKEQLVIIYKTCIVLRNAQKSNYDYLMLLKTCFNTKFKDDNIISNTLSSYNKLEDLSDLLLEILGDYEFKSNVHLI